MGAAAVFIATVISPLNFLGPYVVLAPLDGERLVFLVLRYLEERERRGESGSLEVR